MASLPLIRTTLKTPWQGISICWIPMFKISLQKIFARDRQKKMVIKDQSFVEIIWRKQIFATDELQKNIKKKIGLYGQNFWRNIPMLHHFTGLKSQNSLLLNNSIIFRQFLFLMLLLGIFVNKSAIKPTLVNLFWKHRLVFKNNFNICCQIALLASKNNFFNQNLLPYAIFKISS